MAFEKLIVIVTRGSALALANFIQEKAKPLVQIKNAQPRMDTDGHGYKAQAGTI